MCKVDAFSKVDLEFLSQNSIWFFFSCGFENTICKPTLQITSIQRSNDQDQNRPKLAMNLNHSFQLKQYVDFQQKSGKI